jgi:hypothetical protein
MNLNHKKKKKGKRAGNQSNIIFATSKSMKNGTD